MVGRARLLGVALAAVLCARPALAVEGEQALLDQAVELNKRALAAYDALETDAAVALLEQALGVLGAAGLDKHPTAARLHVHLGVVTIGGLKNREAGLAELRRAISIDPGVKVTKSLSNPEVEAAFLEAQSQVMAAPSWQLPFPTGKRPDTDGAKSAVPGELGGIRHPLVTRAARGLPAPIKAQVPPGLGAARVILAYRAQGKEEFLVREMSTDEESLGWYHEEIPAAATGGGQVAYYLEAQNADDQPLASHGSAEQPHLIALVPAEPEQPPPATPRAAPLEDWLWLALAVGGGGGYYAGSPEMNPTDARSPPEDIEVSGLAWSKLLFLAPEIGFFHRPDLLVSLQGRFQIVSGAEDVHVGLATYRPARLAIAGVAKLTRLFRGRSPLRPFLSVAAGVGQIRQTITTPERARLTGCEQSDTCRDTVLGGPILVGVGGGVAYRVSQAFYLFAALNVLLGMPHMMLNGDASVGVALVP